MEEFFSSTLFKATAAIVAALVVLRVAIRLLFPPKPGPLHLRVRCSSCGWTGTVGKYMKRCSKCNSDALEMVKR